MTIHFDLLNTYNEESRKTLKVMQKYNDQEKEAQQLVNTLKMRYEDTVRKHVTEDMDYTEELQKINGELGAAEADLKNKQRMRLVASKVDKRAISKQLLESEFRKYQAQYQEEHVDAAIMEIRKAKEAYIKKFLKYMGTVNDFNTQAREVHNVLYPNNPFMSYSVGFKSTPHRESNTITSYDLQSLERGLMPKSV
jgi:hypothetical protein